MSTWHAGGVAVVLPRGARLAARLHGFSQPGIDRAGATQAIYSATTILAAATPQLDRVDLMVPIARAGLAMLPPADAATGYVNTLFAICRRRGSVDVNCVWTPPNAATRSRHAVILDVVAATGRTINVVTASLRERAPVLESITLLLCFATPDALETISVATEVPVCAVVGRLCDGVDAGGYVLPTTNGDAGDKLFGALP